MTTTAQFPGGGQCGELIRALDWSRTPLGPSAAWPAALKGLVRALLHARQPMLVWWGPQLIQLYNDAFLPSFGRGKHPLAMGQPARECWPEVWPIVGEQLENVVARGDAIWNEDVLVPVFRDGIVDDAWWTYNYSPLFDDDGARAGVLIICTETTRGVVARSQLEQARKEADRARAELHAAFMQAPIPIAILTGPQHVFTLTNSAYDKLVTRPVMGQPLAQAFSAAEVGYYLPILDRVYATGEPVLIREAELHLTDASGTVADRYIDVGYHPYRGADQEVIGVIAIINDVTAAVWARHARERQEAERAVALAREQELRVAAEAGGRQRDEFLAMLSHELRNPLAPIATATQLMRLSGDQHAKERLIIERQVAHLSRLVDDLLDVARITRGKIELRRQPVEMAEVVAKAVEMASPLLEERAHNLRLDLAASGLTVDGDPVRLAQVVGNLVTNAAKYTPPQGLIDIAAARVGDEVVVTVGDNGPGLDQALLPRVFELFVQGAQRPDRAAGGLGLGLALVKNLVTLHGGSVAARNRPGGGSEFSVRLPALTTTERAPATAAAPARPAATGVSRKVLVVDDNRDAAELLAEVLEAVGHTVVVAFDAPQALAALESFPAEVGLIDLGLPGMDGLELAQHIRARRPTDTPRLVALTGYGQKHDRDGSRAAGFDFHLTKPAPIDEILRVIALERG